VSLLPLAAALASQSVAGLPPDQRRGVGARVPFVEYEAETSGSDGTVIAPERRFGTLAAEASGRSAVLLERAGSHVAVTLDRPANAITVRYAVPDTPDGRGGDWALDVEADGVSVGTLRVTSRYGWFYGAYPFSNDPREGGGHHMFDHARLLLPRMLPAGTRLVLRIGAGNAAPWTAIDLIDLEAAPAPGRRPHRSLSVVDFGADPTGEEVSTEAFQAGIDAARESRRPLWIPPGRFRVDGHLLVDRVTIVGAGMWHSELFGDGVGFYGKDAAVGGSSRVRLRDFALIGEVTERIDRLALSGVGGAISRLRIDRLWLQHHKVGIWLDGPIRDVRIRGTRILDMTADGLNFHRGVVDGIVEDVFVRGTGDDGLAAWSQDVPNRDIIFRRNSVIAPVLANGIAIYGGRDIRIDRNLVADTLTQGGGIHIGNRFGAVPVSGRIRVAGNVVARAGSWDPNWRHGVGAIWFYALDAPMTAAIAVIGGTILDSSEAAFSLTGEAITRLSIRDVAVDRTGSHLLQLRSPATVTIDDLDITRVGMAGALACVEGARLMEGDAPRVPIVDAPCGPTAPATR